jgi:hypothetical protein
VSPTSVDRFRRSWLAGVAALVVYLILMLLIVAGIELLPAAMHYVPVSENTLIGILIVVGIVVACLSFRRLRRRGRRPSTRAEQQAVPLPRRRWSLPPLLRDALVLSGAALATGLLIDALGTSALDLVWMSFFLPQMFVLEVLVDGLGLSPRPDSPVLGVAVLFLLSLPASLLQAFVLRRILARIRGRTA